MSGSDVAITNSILWYDWADTAGTYEIAGAYTINYSNVRWGVTGGQGNLDEPPEFANRVGPDDDLYAASDADLRLLIGSPCLDTGDDLADVSLELSGVQPLPVTDIESGDRIQDGDETAGAVVDMGAHERLNYPTWNSVRGHGAAGDLAVPLDPMDGAWITEPRRYGIEEIEVVFDSDQSGGYTSGHIVVGPSLTLSNEQLTLSGTVLSFELSGSVDQTCYLIDISGSFTALDGDPATCTVGVLSGDANNDGSTNFIDVSLVKDSSGQPASYDPRQDWNTDGSINFIDLSAIKTLVGSSIDCSGGGGGEALMGGGGGELMSMAPMMPLGPISVSASIIDHSTLGDTITLPSGGGTIEVDVVLDHDGPIEGFVGYLAVDASGVVSINASGWTALENVLASYHVPGYETLCAYDFTLAGWYVVEPDGDVGPTQDPEILLGPDAPGLVTLTYSLSELDGAIDTPGDKLYVTTAPLGVVLAETALTGTTNVVTLNLDVAASPGTYKVSLVDGVALTSQGEPIVIDLGSPLIITVGE